LRKEKLLNSEGFKNRHSQMTDYGIEFSKSGGIFSSINKSGTEKPPIFDPEARR
jgi:hypothetical protein